MQILQNNFDKMSITSSCCHCQSFLLINKQDLSIIQRDNGRFDEWFEYRVTCPCCKKSILFKNNPFN